MACRDPWFEEERVEVRWLRPGGVVAESLNLTLETPEEAVEGVAEAWTALVAWRERLALKDSLTTCCL